MKLNGENLNNFIYFRFIGMNIFFKCFVIKVIKNFCFLFFVILVLIEEVNEFLLNDFKL